MADCLRDSRRVRFHVGDIGPMIDPGLRYGPGRRKTGLKALVVFVAVALLATAVTVATLASHGTDTEDGLRARISYMPHAPIVIMGDSEFTEANGVTDGAGTAQDPFVIEGWEIDATSTYGVYILMTTAHYVIRGVHVSGSESMGVALFSAPNGTVEDSLFDEGDYGIVAFGVNGVNITRNTMANLEIGMEFMAVSWANISENDLSNMSMCAMVALLVDNLTFESNVCTGGEYFGVVLATANYTTIRDNTISGCGYMGIAMNDTQGTVIEYNDITGNSRWGVAVMNSTDTRVYHNRFIGNAVQAMNDNSTGTIWDDGYPSGGNYWSDYTGSDSYSGPDQDLPGPDGIGDMPYVTDGGGVDRYPWMTPDFIPIPEFGTLLIPVLIVICALPIAFVRARRRR